MGMAQKGFIYEANVAKFLKKHGMIKPGYTPAGASSDRPDLDIFYGGVEYGCELKIGLASAGSLVLKYDSKTKQYAFNPIDKNDVEKIFLKGVAEKNQISTKLKNKWRKVPYLQDPRDKKWLNNYGHVPLKERYEYDLATHPDVKIPISSTTIERYYNSKKTYYLNVGTHGFYLLGAKDPMGLNKDLKARGLATIPRWKDSHKAIMRVRVQSKGMTKAIANEKRTKNPAGAQGYQFTFELQFQSLTASPYNIGPVRGSSVNIIGKKAVLPFGKVPS